MVRVRTTTTTSSDSHVTSASRDACYWPAAHPRLTFEATQAGRLQKQGSLDDTLVQHTYRSTRRMASATAGELNTLLRTRAATRLSLSCP